MPKKAAVVKTYGRHKYRTVKAQNWLSPDEDFRSPFGKPSHFPSKIEGGCSTNIFKPKSSQWSKPLKKLPTSQVGTNNLKCGTSLKNQGKVSLFDDSDKENDHISRVSGDSFDEHDPSERKLKRKRQTLFSNCTPVSTQKATRQSRLHNSKNVGIRKQGVILVNDTLESNDERNSQVHDVINVEDSGDNLFPGYASSQILDPQNSTNGSPNQCVSFSDNAGLSNCVSHSKDSKVDASEIRQCNFNLTSNMKSDMVPSTSVIDKCHSSYVTSTPVFDLGNCPAIASTCKSDSQDSSLMEGKVVLEPLQITPIQWKKLTLSSTTEKPFKNSHNSIQSLCTEHKNSEVRKLSGASTSGNSSVQLKECVVSLEKLRITPLKNRSKYFMAGLSGDGSYVSNRGKSQLSFVEALTPVKKNQSKCNIEEEDGEELSAFDKVLLECDQEGPVKFTEFLDSSLLTSCAKIGEGVYGEVFRAQYENGQSIALKIIPVEGDFLVNGEPQKSFGEILPEIVISKELSLLGDLHKHDKPMDNMSTNFITVHSVTCCRDKYPSHLISEWDRWNEQHTSENDRPDIFPSDQFFIVFEFSNGGRDLESFEFDALAEAWSVLRQTALALAVAENALEFEHRDLHWGNVLICRTGDEFVESVLLGERKMIPSDGVHVSLIDFTLSRLKKDGVTVFCNLAEDESLFTGKGDYQFDVYRLMKKANQNDWEPFNPHTNALWLHYLTDKLLKKKTKIKAKDKVIETKLKRFLRQAKKCSSATEIVQDCFD